MLTGDLPLGHFSPPSRKVQVDIRFDDVVLRALQNDPDRRYQHVSEVKTQVEIITQSPGANSSSASEPGVADSRDSRTNGRRLTLALALVALLVMIGVVALRKQWGISRGPTVQTAFVDAATGSMVAQLPGGGEVELLGLSEPNSVSGQWWVPDGRLITNRTFHVEGPAEIAMSNVVQRFLAFRFAGLPQDLGSLTYDCEPAANISIGGHVLQDGRKIADGWPLRIAWPMSTRTAVIRIGYSDQPWRTITIHNPNTYTSRHTTETGDPKWQTSLNHVSDDGTDLHLTMVLGPNSKAWKMRVVAVDTDGRVRSHERAMGTPTETSTTWTMSFSGLTKEQVREFQVQVRPVSWIEFNPLALQPNRID